MWLHGDEEGSGGGADAALVTTACSALPTADCQDPAFHVADRSVLIYLEAGKENGGRNSTACPPRPPVRPLSFSAPESPLAVICSVYSSNHKV